MMKKINRRKFLIIGGKIISLGILAWTFPIVFRSQGDLKKAKKKFSILLKPFHPKDLYKKHNLAG